MADFQPAPTHADVILVDEKTQKATFNPLWLNWFLMLTQTLNAAGGTVVDHNSLSGLQGGTANQYYHLTAAEHTVVSNFDESAQDAVGGILVDTATVNLTYNDAIPSISADVLAVPVIDAAGDTTTFIGLFGAASGDLAPLTDAGLTYNASTNTLTTTTVVAALTGNASTATALQTPRTIGGVSFNGTANIVPQTIQIIDAGGDATTFPLLAGSATGSLQPLTDAGLTYNATTNTLTAVSFAGDLAGNAATATALQTARLIGGDSFDGTANILLGIDDNATVEVLELSDTTMDLGQASADFSVRRNADDSRLFITGGSSTATGANLILHGGTETNASDFEIRADTTEIISWDDSAGILALSTIVAIGDQTNAPAFAATDTLIVGPATATGNAGVEILAGATTGTSYMHFADSASRDPGGFQYAHTSETLTTRVGGAARGTWTTSLFTVTTGLTVDGNFTANGTTNTLGNAAADDLVINCDTATIPNGLTLGSGATALTLESTLVCNNPVTVNGNFTANGTTNTIGNAAADDLIINCDTWTLATQTTMNGNITVSGDVHLSSSTGLLGYTTGAGGSVTQATNKSTGVTLNTPCGRITMNNAALAAGAEVAFTVTNARVGATDLVLAVISGAATAAAYNLQVDAIAAGSFRLSLGNMSTGSLSEAVEIQFAVINSVTS